MNFFKTFFASALGAITAIAILFFFGILIIAGIISGAKSDEEIEVKENSILKIELKGAIVERAADSPFEIPAEIPFMGGSSKTGLWDIRESLSKAKNDENIKGIYLVSTDFSAGWATLEAIRKALIDFKESGKFIYAYGEVYSEKSYYLASVADKVFLYPEGFMELNGLATTPFFLKGTFEKLGVKPRVFRVGTYKSAVEPFITDKMSEANREQTQAFLDDMWDVFLKNVAQSRGIAVEDLDKLAEENKISNGPLALKYKLVDELKYEDQILDLLMTETGAKESKDLEFISLAKYKKAPNPATKDRNRKNKIAIVFAEGNIVDGKGQDGEIGSASLAPEIRKAREDSSIKAVVLRVNSPGGSALASDVIWREIILTKAVKPVIVSMGDVAASGGYYISAAADRIFAEPNTITGSIGVFGLMFNTEELYTEKLGLTFDRVYTNHMADIGNPNRIMAEEEAAFIQNSVNEVYSTFLKVVQSGRNSFFADSASVDAIAQGRVWSGSDALNIGLVDELGGLDAALTYAAREAGLEEKDYRVKLMPEQKDKFQEILEKLSGGEALDFAQIQAIEAEMKIYRQITKLLNSRGVQALMPVEYIIE